MSFVLRTTALSGLLLSCMLPTSAATMGKLPYIPTRFHLCSVELGALEGDARDEEMKICLKARFHAEKEVRSQCSTEIKHLRPAPRNADERYQAQRQCFIAHLSASYQDLLEDNAGTAAVNPTHTASNRPATPASPPGAKRSLAAAAAPKAASNTPAAIAMQVQAPAAAPTAPAVATPTKPD
jgi:hypothetical protein